VPELSRRYRAELVDCFVGRTLVDKRKGVWPEAAEVLPALGWNPKTRRIQPLWAAAQRVPSGALGGAWDIKVFSVMTSRCVDTRYVPGQIQVGIYPDRGAGRWRILRVELYP